MIFGLPTAVAGTMIAAVIAAGISLIGLVISKESKVSDFRQAWIDSLRSEIAAVIAHAQSIHNAELAPSRDGGANWQDIRADFVALNEAWAKIKLRLNPTEPASIALLSALEEHEGLFPPAGVRHLENLQNAENRLLVKTQVVLKEEWRRVKRGERVYRGATFAVFVLVAGGLLLLFLRSTFLSRDNEHYLVTERSDTYVDKNGQPVLDLSSGHDVVHLVLEHSTRRIHADCDLSTVDRLDPNASCALRPLQEYKCAVSRGKIMTTSLPLSDITCEDANGRHVYLYVSRVE
jgi:hypothetical protein